MSIVFSEVAEGKKFMGVLKLRFWPDVQLNINKRSTMIQVTFIVTLLLAIEDKIFFKISEIF